MSEVLKVCTGPSIQSNVTHVMRVSKVVFAAIFRVILLMSDVRDSKYTISAYDIFAYNFLNIQPIFNPKKFWKAET